MLLSLIDSTNFKRLERQMFQLISFADPHNVVTRLVRRSCINHLFTIVTGSNSHFSNQVLACLVDVFGFPIIQ
jgi:hypothetical protein